MKLIIILIILIFILLYVYNITIDTFDSGDKTTPSSGADNSDENWWFESNDIKLDKPIIEKNNVKLSWLKPFSLNIDEYFIVLKKNNKKQIFTYKNNDVFINYYIGNIDDGTYKVSLMYKIKNDDEESQIITSLSDHTFTIEHDSGTQMESKTVVQTENNVDVQYSIIKDKLYEFNPIKDNYYINIY